MPAAASHIYVYYRVGTDTAAARATVDALLADVLRATGVSGRLLARCDDASTWMEIYEPVADLTAFSQTLASLVLRHGAAAIAIDRKRHTECFAPLPAASPSTAARTAR